MKRWIIKSKKLAIIVVLTLIIISVLPSTAFCAKNDADIEIEVKAGFNGVARLGAYIPYKVLLINKGRAVNGEVQIESKIDSMSKTAFAKPFSLPEGSIKEVIINAPVFTARKGVNVRVEVEGSTVKEHEYNFTKLVPPEIKTIGVLSSDNAAYNYLNGLVIPVQNSIYYDEEIKVMQAAGVYSTTARVETVVEKGAMGKTESVLMQLSGDDIPVEKKVMNGFDILIISNFDTSTLSEEQKDVLQNWVKDGGTLVLGTGVNWKKVYEPLPEELKNFSVTGNRSIKDYDELADFSESEFSSSVGMDIVTGQIGFEYRKVDKKEKDEQEELDEKDKEVKRVPYSAHINEVIIGDEDSALAVKYVLHQGRILFLTFDPGMEPFSNWEGKQAFWENMLFHASNYQNRFQQRSQGYYYLNSNRDYNMENLTQQVPEDKKPPFMFMFITIAVYILIAGPVMYIILKKKDRRDINWILVPAVALLCLFVIYLVGFQTRYKTAVLNAVSMIYLDDENQKADVITGMGIFNNKKGNLKIAYSKENDIDFDISEQRYRNYVVYSDGNEPEGRLVSKMLFSDKINYELYDVAMWEPRYLTAKKSEPLEGQIIDSVHIEDGIFRAVVKNTTKYEFVDAFMSVGSNFFSVGNILPGRETQIEVDLNSKDVYNSIGIYLDKMYGRSNYPSSVKPPADYQEKLRKMNIINNLLQNQYNSIRGQAKIGLYALNYQSMEYDMQINDNNPECYYSNGIFYSVDMHFEKGKDTEIPQGIIIPYMEENINGERTARMEDLNGVRVMQEGNIDFTFPLPENIEYKQFSLEFGTYVPLHIKYNMESMEQRDKSFQGSILQNQYEYYIYNNSSDDWEEIGEKYTQSADTSDYIDNEMKLKLRVRVVKMPDELSETKYVEYERLAFPEIELRGVAK